MSDFKARFEAYGGDYTATMERILGDEAFLLEMLGMLAKDTAIDELEQALAANDLQAAFSAAHELKGVAGNLGLTPLYRALSDIVEPLRSGTEQDYSALLQDVRREFDAACALMHPQGE